MAIDGTEVAPGGGMSPETGKCLRCGYEGLPRFEYQPSPERASAMKTAQVATAVLLCVVLLLVVLAWLPTVLAALTRKGADSFGQSLDFAVKQGCLGGCCATGCFSTLAVLMALVSAVVVSVLWAVAVGKRKVRVARCPACGSDDVGRIATPSPRPPGLES